MSVLSGHTHTATREGLIIPPRICSTRVTVYLIQCAYKESEVDLGRPRCRLHALSMAVTGGSDSSALNVGRLVRMV